MWKVLSACRCWRAAKQLTPFSLAKRLHSVALYIEAESRPGSTSSLTCIHPAQGAGGVAAAAEAAPSVLSCCCSLCASLLHTLLRCTLLAWLLQSLLNCQQLLRLFWLPGWVTAAADMRPAAGSDQIPAHLMATQLHLLLPLHVARAQCRRRHPAALADHPTQCLLVQCWLAAAVHGVALACLWRPSGTTAGTACTAAQQQHAHSSQVFSCSCVEAEVQVCNRHQQSTRAHAGAVTPLQHCRMSVRALRQTQKLTW
jgi:hypothetical protein